MFKNIKTSPSLLFWQDIYWRSRFKENLWSVWKFGLLCTFSILFCPTFKIQKLEWNLLETKSSFNCFNPKVHPRNNQGDRARVNLITTKGASGPILGEKIVTFSFWEQDFESLNLFLKLYIHPFSTKKLYPSPIWWSPPDGLLFALHLFQSTQPNQKKINCCFLKKTSLLHQRLWQRTCIRCFFVF